MAVVVVLALCSVAQAATFKAGLSEQQIQQRAQQMLSHALQSPSLKISANIPGVIFSDSFETGVGAWDVYSFSNTVSATWGATGYRATVGTHSAYCVGSKIVAPGPYPANTDSEMDSPWFSLAGRSTATPNFDMWLDSKYNADGLIVWVVGVTSPQGLQVAQLGWTGQSSGWVHESIDLGAVQDVQSGQAMNFLGLSQVLVGFEFVSDGVNSNYQGAYIDNVVVKDPHPVVTSVSPAFGPLAGGTSVTISGVNFTGATGVTVGGVAATDVAVVNDSTITATVPAQGAAGTCDVLVTTPVGTSAAAGTGNDFAYAGTPTITSISPASGVYTGGTTVTITGTGFYGLSGASAVTFGGVNATSYHVISPTQMTAVTPAHALGKVDTVVTAVGGTSDPSGTTDDYTYALPRYEQTLAGIGFSSGWSAYSNAAYSGGSYKYTNVPGSTVTIAFVGTELDWITVKGPDFGKANVSVDNGTPTEVDLYNATNAFQQKVFSASGLSSGLHTFTITCLGTKNASATNTYVGLDAVECDGTLATVSFCEQNDARILFKGAWLGYANSLFSCGNYHYTKNPGTMIVVPFSGQKFEWIATMGPVYGKANVSIDGAPATAVDLYAAAYQYKQTVYASGILTSGAHTATISYTGLRNAAATDTYINADAFQVVGTFTSATPFDQTNAKFVWTKTWTLGSGSYYYGSSFRYVNTSGASVRINFTGSSLSYIAKKAPNMGKAYVSIDGGAAVLVDLYNATTAYQQKVWSTGGLTPGNHYVTITWSGQRRAGATGTYINIDAVTVVGTLR
jgi:hypothetical protein